MRGNKELFMTVMCRHASKPILFALMLLEIRALFNIVIHFKCSVFWYSNIKLFISDSFCSVSFLRT